MSDFDSIFIKKNNKFLLQSNGITRRATSGLNDVRVDVSQVGQRRSGITYSRHNLRFRRWTDGHFPDNSRRRLPDCRRVSWLHQVRSDAEISPTETWTRSKNPGDWRTVSTLYGLSRGSARKCFIEQPLAVVGLELKVRVMLSFWLLLTY